LQQWLLWRYAILFKLQKKTAAVAAVEICNFIKLQKKIAVVAAVEIYNVIKLQKKIAVVAAVEICTFVKFQKKSAVMAAVEIYMANLRTAAQPKSLLYHNRHSRTVGEFPSCQYRSDTSLL
jgi:hypothetical protein